MISCDLSFFPGLFQSRKWCLYEIFFCFPWMFPRQWRYDDTYEIWDHKNKTISVFVKWVFPTPEILARCVASCERTVVTLRVPSQMWDHIMSWRVMLVWDSRQSHSDQDNVIENWTLENLTLSWLRSGQVFLVFSSRCSNEGNPVIGCGYHLYSELNIIKLYFSQF